VCRQPVPQRRFRYGTGQCAPDQYVGDRAERSRQSALRSFDLCRGQAADRGTFATGFGRSAGRGPRPGGGSAIGGAVHAFGDRTQRSHVAARQLDHRPARAAPDLDRGIADAAGDVDAGSQLHGRILELADVGLRGAEREMLPCLLKRVAHLVGHRPGLGQ
jgi:hypothetical protein